MASRIAVVTGASAGIGRALALRLVAAGYEPFLVARRAPKLKEVAGDVRAAGGKAHTLELDICSKGAGEKLLAAASAAGDVEVLVNNAGIATYDLFANTTPADSFAMIDLNVKALIELTHLFLPGMLAKKKGYLLQIASTAGFQGIPYQTIYAATKAFVITFTEALAVELKGTGVKTTALCPGPTESEFFETAQYEKKGLAVPKIAVMSAEEVADIGVRAMLKGKPMAIAGLANKASSFVTRLAPRSFVAATAGMLFRPRGTPKR